MKAATILLVFVTLLGLSACGSKDPKPSDTPVTAEELLGYQMYWGLKAPDGTIHLRFLYFEKTGNAIKATLDGTTSRIILPVNIQNNTLSLDLNGNGGVVYTFEYGRDGDRIKVTSAKFYNIANPGYQLADGATILSLSEFSSVKNTTFKGPNDAVIVRFNADTWLYGEYPSITGTYYECGKGGFKGKINGVDHMGIYFSPNKDIKGIILQKAGGEVKSYLLY